MKKKQKKKTKKKKKHYFYKEWAKKKRPNLEKYGNTATNFDQDASLSLLYSILILECWVLECLERYRILVTRAWNQHRKCR